MKSLVTLEQEGSNGMASSPMLDMEVMLSVLQTVNSSAITNMPLHFTNICDGTGIYCLQYGGHEFHVQHRKTSTSSRSMDSGIKLSKQHEMHVLNSFEHQQRLLYLSEQHSGKM